MPGETPKDAGLSAKDEMMRVLKKASDGLIVKVKERTKRLQDLHSRLGFILDMDMLLDSGR